MDERRFKIGDRVKVISRMTLRTPHKVVGCLPRNEQGFYEYRVRCLSEPHERLVPEPLLAAIEEGAR